MLTYKTNIMKTLIENLYNNNVIFSYYGFIDESVLKQVLEITRSKLEQNKEPQDLVNKVYAAINECADNIIKHNFYHDDSKVRYKSLLVVSKQDEAYHVNTINVVNQAQRENINEQLNFLHSRSHDELVALKSKVLLPSSTGLISSGLLDLVLKADNCECTFKDQDENYLFNVSYKINASLN